MSSTPALLMRDFPGVGVLDAPSIGFDDVLGPLSWAESFSFVGNRVPGAGVSDSPVDTVWALVKALSFEDC